MKTLRKFCFMAAMLLAFGFKAQAQQNLKTILMEKIEQFFLQRFNVSEQNLRLTYLRFPHLGQIKLQNLTIECSAQSNLLRLGRQSIWLHFLKDQKVVLKTPVTVDVSIRKRVFLTHENIGYRQRIPLEQVQARELWIRDSEIYLKAIASEEQIAGKETTHFIPRGKILLTTDVQQPTVVKPGDRVEICVRAGDLVLRTSGIARSAGSVGDVVSVKNTMTGKLLKGKVTSPGIVFINPSRSL